MKVVTIVGTRPQFIKAGSLSRLLREDHDEVIVHTGQHYDDELSRIFFEQLDLPMPERYLGVGGGTNTEQTAKALTALEPELRKICPDLVIVYGDSNPTLAGALCAAQLRIPVAHVEAGLRSFERDTPEELNRKLADQLADICFTTEEIASENLRRAGVPPDRVHLVGNVLIDSLLRALPFAHASTVLHRLGVSEHDYCIATFHRVQNIEDDGVLFEIVAGLEAVGEQLPVVFPLHPRTRTRMEKLGFEPRADRLRVTRPLGYLDFLKLLSGARVAVTDSGGIQEETTFLGIPCLTIRPVTERPVTLALGTNRLVAADRRQIELATRRVLESPPRGGIPPFWDGRAGERIVSLLKVAR
jgi:UDP-N-acetylglucosamine 2-epimerase (non-hydrolysing)